MTDYGHLIRFLGSNLFLRMHTARHQMRRVTLEGKVPRICNRYRELHPVV
jgi:hypothetical protein